MPLPVKKIFFLINFILINCYFFSYAQNISLDNHSNFINKENKKIILRISHSGDINSIEHKSIEQFKLSVEKLSNHQMEVKVFAKSQLYNANEEMEALQVGISELAILNFDTIIKSGIKEYELLKLPYLFTDLNKAHYLLDNQIGQKLGKKLNDKNIYLLNYWDQGFKQFSSLNNLDSLENLKDLNVLTNESENSFHQMELLRTNPYYYSDIIKAIKEKKINVVEDTIINLYHNNVFKYYNNLLITSHSYDGSAFVINYAFWQRLNSSQQEIVKNSAQLATQYSRSLTANYEYNIFNWLKKSNKVTIKIISQKDLQFFKKIMIVSHEKQLNNQNKELLLEIYQQLKK